MTQSFILTSFPPKTALLPPKPLMVKKLSSTKKVSLRYNIPMIYAFILGTNHSLCKVEILNVLTNKGIDVTVLESSQEGLILETKVELEKELNIDDFGSTAKIVKILATPELKDFFENYSRYITERNFVDELLVTSKGKHLLFGISVY